MGAVTGTGPAHVDIAVVGAGVIGCLTAREVLSRWPHAKVALVERDMVACGASRRSAGLHFPRGSSPQVRDMAAFSERYYRRLKDTTPALPVREVTTTVVAAETAEARLREAYLPGSGLLRIDHVPTPLALLPAGHAAWRVTGSQYADVPGVTQLIATELRPRVRFFEGTRVTSVASAPDHVDLVLSSGTILRAAHVVLAPGPWLHDPAWHSWLAPLDLRVKKVVALHVEWAPRSTDGVVVFEDDDAFLLPLHHRGHWLFSYTCQEWDVTPERAGPQLTQRDLAEAHAVLRRFAPEMAPSCTTGRVFCDAYSSDRVPLVQPVDDHGRVIFTGAANGSGYRLAPALAARAAALINPAPVPPSRVRPAPAPRSHT